MFLFSGVYFSNQQELTVEVGQNVTLHVNKTQHDFNSNIWTFERHPNFTAVTIVNNGEVTKLSESTFRNRLILDIETGSITIFNLTTNDSGLFQVHFIIGKEAVNETFKVTVSGESPFHYLP